MNIKKNNSWNQGEIPKASVSVQCAVQCTLLISSVLQNSNLWPWKQLREWWVFLRIKQWTSRFFFCVCLATSTCPFDKPLRKKKKKEGNWMFPNLQRGPASMRSVYKSNNKYRHPNRLQQQIFLKTFFSLMHTHKHTSEIMSFLNPLN